ncbi:MAG: hypothetical protein E7575_01310 [Ruminococcaceae bacterium]|nr:hypothetical protein [Oscillospiraceae bacterium]
MFKESFSHEAYEYMGETRKYRFHKPENFDENGKYPVVLFLHGAGERGDDNDAQLRIGIGTALSDPESPLHNAFIIAPQVPLEKQWVASSWDPGTYDLDNTPETPYIAGAVSIVKSVMEKYPCDKDNVYVMGISMGGFGSWDALCRYPQLFVGGFICCGGTDASKARKICEKKIYTYHGDEDPVVNVRGTRAMVGAIMGCGGKNITYREYEGMGHWTWDRAFAEFDDINALFAN